VLKSLTTMDVRLLLLLAGWVAGWWLLWVVPRLHGRTSRDDVVDVRTEPDEDGVADVAVVIPVRDEAETLPRLLDSLARQRVRPRQIIVVDDQSTDGTAEVVLRWSEAEPSTPVTLLRGDPLPGGWTGKAWACHQAVPLVRAGTLVFLDADVTLGDDGLRAVLGALEARGGLVSVQPYHRMERAYERFSALFNVVGMMGVGAASPGRDGRSSGAFGPVLACRRRDYEAIGGHAAVRGEIVEDIALARRFRDVGLPVSTLGGGEVISFRMYPQGLAQLLEGWTKNIATGAGSVAWPRRLLIGAWVSALLVTVQTAIEAVLAPGESFRTMLSVALVAYALFAVQLRVMLRQLGNFGVLATALFPALVGIFVAVFARSLWFTVVRRQVRWRGRTIPLSAARRWEPSTAPAADGGPP
jgi:4,4'-diaponeurosporenoate glycosyltransferase